MFYLPAYSQCDISATKSEGLWERGLAGGNFHCSKLLQAAQVWGAPALRSWGIPQDAVLLIYGRCLGYSSGVLHFLSLRLVIFNHCWIWGQVMPSSVQRRPAEAFLSLGAVSHLGPVGHMGLDCLHRSMAEVTSWLWGACKWCAQQWVQNNTMSGPFFPAVSLVYFFFSLWGGRPVVLPELVGFEQEPHPLSAGRWAGSCPAVEAAVSCQLCRCSGITCCTSCLSSLAGADPLRANQITARWQEGFSGGSYPVTFFSFWGSERGNWDLMPSFQEGLQTPSSN